MSSFQQFLSAIDRQMQNAAVRMLMWPTVGVFAASAQGLVDLNSR